MDATHDSVIAAHKHCLGNRQEVTASDKCGCFYRLRIFEAKEITEWLHESNGKGDTAFCPYCFIDAVIGSRSGYPITSQFLTSMKSHWFDTKTKPA